MDVETLCTILEAQIKAQQQMFTELIKRMEKMASVSHLAVPTAPVAKAEFVWYNRYEDIILKDDATLDDAAEARLIVSKLDTVTHARFTNHILPQGASGVPLTDTVAALMELFGHNTLVNQRHAMADFNDVTPEQMKCLVWICGHFAPPDADVRARALRKMGKTLELR
ncbi:hypothetical protein RB195_023524 [Necator americanus]|uniref:DUF7083 domain-containing protein n=1 Tax=Necator americanus TaxID=51031 RepID=A0ABR1EJQ8_NECAM